MRKLPLEVLLAVVGQDMGLALVFAPAVMSIVRVDCTAVGFQARMVAFRPNLDCHTLILVRFGIVVQSQNEQKFLTPVALHLKAGLSDSSSRPEFDARKAPDTEDTPFVEWLWFEN